MDNNLPSYVDEAIKEFERNIGFYYSYFIDRALVAPDIVQITLSYRCNLRCKMCNIRNIKVNQEMTSGKIFSIIDESAEWGVPEVLFLGGEPFLHPSLMEFVNYAGSKGLNTTIVTNGTLIDEKMAKKIVRSPLTQLVVSLDGAKEKTHDSLRGLKGAYRKIIQSIRLVDRYKQLEGKKRFEYPLIIIPMTLMNANLGEMWRYVVLGNRLPVSAVGFQPVVIDNTNLRFDDPTHPMWIPNSRLSLLDKMVDRVIDYKKRRRQDQPVIGNTYLHLKAIRKYFRGELSQKDIKCYIGYTRVVISPDGDTSLCGRGIGNVNFQSMREFWNSEAARRERIRIRECSRPCLQFCTLRPQSELANAFKIFCERIDFTKCDKLVLDLIRERLLNKFCEIKRLLREDIKDKIRLGKLLKELESIQNKVNSFKRII